MGAGTAQQHTREHIQVEWIPRAYWLASIAKSAPGSERTSVSKREIIETDTQGQLLVSIFILSLSLLLFFFPSLPHTGGGGQHRERAYTCIHLYSNMQTQASKSTVTEVLIMAMPSMRRFLVYYKPDWEAK